MYMYIESAIFLKYNTLVFNEVDIWFILLFTAVI